MSNSWRCYSGLLEEFGTDAGIRSVINHEYLRVGEPDPPQWLQSILWPSEISECSVDFAERHYDRVWKFQTIVIDMSRYMSWLGWWAQSLGVAISERHLQSVRGAFGEDTHAVVNCSGLGARRLVPDKTVRPVRGQLLFFEPVERSTSDRLVAVGVDEYCLIPRITDVGLGSLLHGESNRNETRARYSHQSEQLLLAALDQLLRLSGAGDEQMEFSGRAAFGLRPIREDGCRLEAAQTGAGLIVHNYGHGGAGVTLAWGCADRVAEMIATEFNGLSVHENAEATLSETRL